MSSKSELIKICVLGMPATGKTALVVKVLSGRFIWTYDPTIEDVYKHSMADTGDEGAEAYSLEIMDTAGYTATKLDSVQTESYVKWADAFVLLYSITDLQSFDAVDSLLVAITEVKKLGCNVAIVANKADLAHLRQVDTDVGQKLAHDNACRFYELSARIDQETIKEPFLDLCRDIRAKRTREGIKLRRRSSASKLLRKLIQKKLSI